MLRQDLVEGGVGAAAEVGDAGGELPLGVQPVAADGVEEERIVERTGAHDAVETGVAGAAEGEVRLAEPLLRELLFDEELDTADTAAAGTGHGEEQVADGEGVAGVGQGE